MIAGQEKKSETVFKAHSSVMLPSKENIKLFEASEGGWASAVKQWLEKGGSPDYFHRPEDQKNSLHVAAEFGHVEVVEVLLEAGVLVDGVAITSQNTALMFASQNSDPAVTKILLAKGAKPDIANGYGNTALHTACTLSHLYVAQELIKDGASLKLANNKGSSPLHLLCYDSTKSIESEDLCKLLIKSGADITAKDNLGLTAFLVCCTSGRDDLVKILLREGANLKDKDNSGKGAIAIAKFYGHKNIEDLVQRG